MEYIEQTSIGDIFKSRTLKALLMDLDDRLTDMETYIEELELKNKEFKEEQDKEMIARFKESQMMIGQTLKTILSVPDAKAISTITATMLFKIKNMKTIEEVHAYIEAVIESIQKTEIKQR